MAAPQSTQLHPLGSLWREKRSCPSSGLTTGSNAASPCDSTNCSLQTTDQSSGSFITSQGADDFHLYLGAHPCWQMSRGKEVGKGGARCRHWLLGTITILLLNSGTCCALSVTSRSAVLLCPQLLHPPGVLAPQFFSSCLSFPLPVSFGAGEEWKWLFWGPCASLIRRVKVSLWSHAGVWLLWEDIKPSIRRPADDLTHTHTAPVPQHLTH